MSYDVKFHPAFIPEWKGLEMGLKELVGEVLDHLEDDGPFLGRPEVDTLSGSGHANMKEIRVTFVKQVCVSPLPSTPPKLPLSFAAGRSKVRAKSSFTNNY